MRYRLLCQTGIKVSPYRLGAMMFGGIGNPDHDECVRMIHKALDAGINFIDTADRYSAGESEEIVGQALKGRRDRVVLATKVHGPMGDDPNMQGNSRRWITRALEDWLRRLQTGHIDLYQIHRPAPDTDVEETLSCAHRPDARGQGSRDRHFDLSSLRHRRGSMGCRAARPRPVPHRAAALFYPEPVDRARSSADMSALRHGRDGVELACQGHAHRPVPQGHADTRLDPREFFPKAMSDEGSLNMVEQLIPLAEGSGISLTHMALGFVLAHPALTSAIIGPRTMEHLDSLPTGAGVALSDEVLDRIDEIVPPVVDVVPLETAAYSPPPIVHASLRRRPLAERKAA